RSEHYGDPFAVVEFAFEDSFEVAQRPSLDDDFVALLQRFADTNETILVDASADNLDNLIFNRSWLPAEAHDVMHTTRERNFRELPMRVETRENVAWKQRLGEIADRAGELIDAPGF